VRLCVCLSARKTKTVDIKISKLGTGIVHHDTSPTCLYLVKHSPDGATTDSNIDCSLLLIYRPREDERLSWPSWLAYSGRFTHINGYPSAAGPVEASESSPVRDRRSTTELHRHP